jgi:gas vesicle protein
MNKSKILLGVLGGVAAGALVGVLFAPAKGTKTRRRIMKKGNDFTDDLKSKFDDLLEKATCKCNDLIEEAEEMMAENQAK